MNTTVVCREVRPAAGSGKCCVVIATQDEPVSGNLTDTPDRLNLAEVKERLRAQGIVLGGKLAAAEGSRARSSLSGPVQLIAHDEHGTEHRLIANQFEECNLSSGSTLYYFFIGKAPGDCRWLVNRTLEVAEVAQEFRSDGSEVPGQSCETSLT